MSSNRGLKTRCLIIPARYNLAPQSRGPRTHGSGKASFARFKPPNRENTSNIHRVSNTLLFPSSYIQSTTRTTEFFVVGKMSGILVAFVILVGTKAKKGSPNIQEVHKKPQWILKISDIDSNGFVKSITLTEKVELSSYCRQDHDILNELRE